MTTVREVIGTGSGVHRIDDSSPATSAGLVSQAVSLLELFPFSGAVRTHLSRGFPPRPGCDNIPGYVIRRSRNCAATGCIHQLQPRFH